MKRILEICLTSMALLNLVGCGSIEAKESTEVQNEEVVQKIEESKVKLSAVGDILIHDRVYNAAKIGENQFDFTPAFLHVKDELSKSDVTIANAETIIAGTQYGLSGYPMFNSPIEIGETLKDVGIDLVTLANNHIFDRGEKALDASLLNWNNIGIPYIGAYRNQEEQEEIYIVEKNNVKLAFLAYTYGTNGMKLPEDTQFGTKFLDEEVMKKEIQQAREQADVVIVSPHYGQEYKPLPNEEQKKWAQFFADEGVDIVIGTHPHVLQPPAFLTGRNGNQTYVMYSLGNFFSGQQGIERQIGGVFSISIVKEETGHIRLEKPEVLLTCVSSKEDKEYVIYPLNEVPLDFLPNRDDIYNETLKQMQLFTPLTIK